MRNAEFYVKQKVSYRPGISPFVYKRSGWLVVLILPVAFLIGPSVIYKRLRLDSFSIGYYLQLVEYCLLVALPFVFLLFWVNWRESIKRKRGYYWLGKFEVNKKHSSVFFKYLQVTPGDGKLRVDRDLFDSVRIGDFIVVRRDALGNVEEIKRDNVQARLARNSGRFPGKNYFETAL